MEDYDLRSCFLPDLDGLHLRIYQFQRLLHHHMPELAAHLDSLGIESAYLSQWFLSFFAVTCPLPMLFRIYDVLFAEGASETIMRVALALMKRNERKILGLSEFEDVMQLLLGRSLWDPYGRNAKSADELVNDFVSFTNDVTKERLQSLEAGFKEEQAKETSHLKVEKSATSFLGRLWGPSATKSVALSPLSPGLTARPLSFLRRTPSKQSLASTLNSMEGSDSSSATHSTALTDLSRGSSTDAFSMKTGRESVALSIRTGHSTQDRDLHYQIEQLLLSVSQLQRQNSELEAALQKQREDRKEDHRVVRTVIDKARDKQPTGTLAVPSSRQSRRRTTITSATPSTPDLTESSSTPLSPELAEVVEVLDKQFPASQTRPRASSIFETKETLRDSLTRTKEQLSNETVRAQSLARDLHDRESDLQLMRETLRDTRHRLQESYNTNQRHEKTIQELRSNARKPSLPWGLSGSAGNDTPPESLPSLSRSNTSDSSVSTHSGLRELRLGRTPSTKSIGPPQHFAKRTSSLATQSVLSTENQTPAQDEALLLELVNAKTAEAVARQELEEMKSKFESMRKAMGVKTSSTTPPSANAAGGTLNMVGGNKPPTPATTPTPIITPPSTTAVGGFWSGWGKRSASTTSATLPTS